MKSEQSRISVRISKHLKTRLMTICAIHNLSQTDLIKKIILDYPANPKRDSRAMKLYQEDSEVISAFNKLNRNINRCGINLNQIARRANENESLDTDKVSNTLETLKFQISMTQTVLDNVRDIFSNSVDTRR